MNFLTKTEFRSKIFPEVRFTLRVVTYGRRIEMLRSQAELNGDLEWRRNNRALWNTLVADFDGLDVDGAKPSVEDVFLNGPEALVEEVTTELVRLATPLGATDSGDEAMIEAAERQIVEARARIEARKNSEPRSSGLTPGAATPTAADATATPTRPAPSASGETATAGLGT